MKKFRLFPFRKKGLDFDELYESYDLYKADGLPRVRPLAKEPYLLPQPEGLLRVKDLLFAEADGVRCVLLRWIMEADFPVDTMIFELSQLDAADECMGTVTLTYGREELSGLRKGDLLTPLAGIPVDSRCAAVRVQVVEVSSGRYIYRVKGTRVEAGYRPPEYWAYDKKPGRSDDLPDKVPLRVASKGRGRARFVRPVAILAVLLMLFLILYPYIRPFIPEPEEETTEAETLGVEPAVSGDDFMSFDEFMTMGEDGVVEYTTTHSQP